MTTPVRSRSLAAAGNRATRVRSTPLREAAEETGVDPAGVTPLLLLPRLLPRLFIRASGFDVSAVVGYWHQPSLLAPTDPAETERAFSIALHELAQPRRWLEYAVAGWRGPSTRLDGGVLLWGYTAEVLMFMSNNI